MYAVPSGVDDTFLPENNSNIEGTQKMLSERFQPRTTRLSQIESLENENKTRSRLLVFFSS